MHECLGDAEGLDERAGTMNQICLVTWQPNVPLTSRVRDCAELSMIHLLQHIVVTEDTF